MHFFKPVDSSNYDIRDAQNNRIIPRVIVSAKKGIWYENTQWNCFKRNQFHLSVQIKTLNTLIYIQSSRVKSYKIEVSCSGVLDSKKVHIHQRTKNGVGIAQPVYIPVAASINTCISKLQFSRSTPLNKSRNLSDSYFQLVVKVSALTANSSTFEIITFTSENLNVLSGTPSQYCVDKLAKFKQLPFPKPNFAQRTNCANEAQIQSTSGIFHNEMLFNPTLTHQSMCTSNMSNYSCSDCESTKSTNIPKLIAPMFTDPFPSLYKLECNPPDPVDEILFHFLKGLK
ncbi:hypothetical protein HDV06_001663 [Boothiomyces sp. JEL0866]|nr:hypothetical protein HDV06_001663 [Boothiomyces sp. JEL0866]